MQISENTSRRLQIKFSNEFRTHCCGIIIYAIPVIYIPLLLLVILLADYSYTLTCHLLPSHSGTTCRTEISNLRGKSSIEVENVTQAQIRSRRRATQSGSVTYYEIVFVTESDQQIFSGFNSANREEEEKRVKRINLYLENPVASGLEINAEQGGLWIWIVFIVLYPFGIYTYYLTPSLKKAIQEKRIQACLFDRDSGKFIVTEGNVLGQIVKKECQLEEIKLVQVAVGGRFKNEEESFLTLTEYNQLYPAVTIIESPTDTVYSTVLVIKSNIICLLSSHCAKEHHKIAHFIKQFLPPATDENL